MWEGPAPEVAILPTRHPDELMLFAYAAGNGDPAVDLVVGTHLALCPPCRREVQRLEAVGGEVLAGLGSSVGGVSLETVLDRLDLPNAPPLPGGQNRRLPEPLRSLVGPWDAAPWIEFPGGFRLLDLPTGGRAPARLACLPPGATVPFHTHSGSEVLLVLTGAFHDGIARFGRGDVSVADEMLSHDMTILPGETCIAVVVREGPLREVLPDGSAGAELPGY